MKKCFIALLAFVIFMAYMPNPAFAEENEKEIIYLPILMYHQISQKPSKLGEYVITDAEFESDLKLLQKYGYTTITLQDLLDFTSDESKLPDKPVMLTFDDGFESDYVYAFPLLKKYNMKAVFSVIGRYTDFYSGDVHKHINYSHTSWEQVKEMYESGLADFQSHTYNMHINENRRGALKKKSESMDQYKKTLYNDSEQLNKAYIENIGFAPKGFACPFGHYNNDLRDTLKNLGYTAILTSHQKINKLTGDPEELYKLSRFVRSHNKDVEKLINSWEGTIAVDKKSASKKEKMR